MTSPLPVAELESVRHLAHAPFPMMNPELAAWAEEALDLGFGSFSDGDHNPFVMLVDASGQQHLTNLQTASGSINEDLLSAGRELIQQFADGQLYALVWDGFLTTDGKRQDAVFAEVGASEGLAFIFAQRYKASRAGKLSKIGTPIAAAGAAHLWHGTGA